MRHYRERRRVNLCILILIINIVVSALPMQGKMSRTPFAIAPLSRDVYLALFWGGAVGGPVGVV